MSLSAVAVASMSIPARSFTSDVMIIGAEFTPLHLMNVVDVHTYIVKVDLP